MIPAQRIYWLLILGTIVGTGMATLGSSILPAPNLGTAILLTLAFDAVLLGLTVLDGLRVKPYRVEVQREPLERLSIGRENPIRLRVQSGDRAAQLQIRDDYPQTFRISESFLSLSLAANASETLTYTAFPSQRGEYDWGNIHIRQLGSWGLAWYQWTIPQRQTVAVYPDLIGLRSLSIQLTLPFSKLRASVLWPGDESE
jgi:uncharacterized protein (DUF58 family)